MIKYKIQVLSPTGSWKDSYETKYRNDTYNRALSDLKSKGNKVRIVEVETTERVIG